MSFPSEPDAILIAEGDALIRMVMVDMLSDAGFTVVAVADAAGALAVLETRAEIRALITGRTLTALGDGIGLIQRARVGWPGLALLITSGSASDLTSQIPTGVRIVWKPFHYHVLAQVIAQEIRGSDGPSAIPLLPEGLPTSPAQPGLAAAAAPVREPDRN
ncbi:response regulator [Methylobacterium radiodurans]|uniref:Response regulator n=1 Tax=Methylobacterium radiodurans TaxID=2202828 RepID=A0A2U8VRG2_9HYPH|nr:response regulator [Methylobacterium radiodurans]AWN36283.1 response regulator [Methylobacterium radiodurans]